MNKRKSNSITQFTNSDNHIKKSHKTHKSENTPKRGRDYLDSSVMGFPAMDRARQVKESLSREFPSFIKPVHRSNVAGRFCLYLPKEFCDEHLPKHDQSLVLVDENEDEYNVKYVLLRNKLDGGWRGFSNEHKLAEGDALVFQLIDRLKFKVYIVRVAEVNGALGHDKKTDHARSVDAREKSGSNHQEGSRPLKTIINFEDIECFEDFQVSVGDLVLDFEIPKELKEQYYELCCSQEMFLHDNLIEVSNSKLAAGMICETARVAILIKSANIATSLQDLKHADKSLEALEILGMSVKFMRSQLSKLIRVACEFKAVEEAKREKRAQLDKDIVDFDETLMKAKVLMNGLDAEIKALEKKSEKLSIEFKEIARAPW